MVDLTAILSCFALIAWLYLAFLHGRFWQLLLDPRAPQPATWPSVDIIVPARNEADLLANTLPSLLRQDYPGAWKIILVDDHSTDDTGEIARNIAHHECAHNRLSVIIPPELTGEWTGKLAAMNAGAGDAQADYILFTDADIEHPVHSLRRLVARAMEKDLDLTSRMVRLHSESPAERLLVPAFVFFFAMLYPFRRVNNPDSTVAAAAGGVMLVKRQTLNRIGGLACIKSALIDDCSLAKAIKQHGGKVELTHTNDITSMREYPRFADIHRLVARTAYTQLRYSPLLLAGTCFGMVLLFLLPPLILLSGIPLAVVIGAAAWLLMSLIYLPTVRFYKQPTAWTLTLPVAAALYVLATLDSARLYYEGKGGQWKGRAQA